MAHDHHDHEHQHHGRKTYDRAFLIGIALNTGFVIVETVYGFLANSLALLADAGHNLSDVLGLLLAWVAASLAKRLPSARYTYGMKRISIVAALANSAFLLVAVCAIVCDAFQCIVMPPCVADWYVICV